ncbi:hypothetical protein BOS5A_10547 [Bosea sp. EC-HK365B]|nr:hypothetical protein BOSE7B_150610 [Bosea sp. 7B]VVT44664.1 hypothetical protein BOS5A_10547 [Bosea sp. EC-HK365B]
MRPMGSTRGLEAAGLLAEPGDQRVEGRAALALRIDGQPAAGRAVEIEAERIDQRAGGQFLGDIAAWGERDAEPGDGGADDHGVIAVTHGMGRHRAAQAMRLGELGPEGRHLEMLQQRHLLDVGGTGKAAQALERCGCCNQRDPAAEEIMRLAILPGAEAVNDLEVGLLDLLLADEIGELDVDLGMGLSEFREALHQPALAGDGDHVQPDRPADRGTLGEAAGAALHLLDRSLGIRTIDRAGLGGLESDGAAFEQLGAEMVFQRLDLLGDGALGQVNFAGSLRRRAEAGDSEKDPERRGRRREVATGQIDIPSATTLEEIVSFAGCAVKRAVFQARGEHHEP